MLNSFSAVQCRSLLRGSAQCATWRQTSTKLQLAFSSGL